VGAFPLGLETRMIALADRLLDSLIQTLVKVWIFGFFEPLSTAQKMLKGDQVIPVLRTFSPFQIPKIRIKFMMLKASLNNVSKSI